MTPAQRKYDLDLAASMHRMAKWIEPRSRKVSLTLKMAAERIEALTSGLPITTETQIDKHGNIQPASTPDGAKL